MRALARPAAALALRSPRLVPARAIAPSSLATMRRTAVRGLATTPPGADDKADATEASATEHATTAADEAAAGEGADGAAATDGADYTAELESRVAELEEEVKSKHDQVLRSLAEAENARRRAKIDVEDAHKFAVGKFAKDLLDVADNLTRAQEAVPEDMRTTDEHPQLKALYEGVGMTESVLLKTFEKHGLVKIWPLDEKFDPNFHDALFEMPDPTKEPGTVGHVANAGYVLNERCIRPAGVGIVAKPA